MALGSPVAVVVVSCPSRVPLLPIATDRCLFGTITPLAPLTLLMVSPTSASTRLRAAAPLAAAALPAPERQEEVRVGEPKREPASGSPTQLHAATQKREGRERMARES